MSVILRCGAMALAAFAEPAAAFDVDLNEAQMQKALGDRLVDGAAPRDSKTVYVFRKCHEDDHVCGSIAADLPQGESAWVGVSDLCQEDGKLMLTGKAGVSGQASVSEMLLATRALDDSFTLSFAKPDRAPPESMVYLLYGLLEQTPCDRALGWALDRRLFPITDINGQPTLSALTSHLLGKEVAP